MDVTTKPTQKNAQIYSSFNSYAITIISKMQIKYEPIQEEIDSQYSKANV